jgi:transposase
MPPKRPSQASADTTPTRRRDKDEAQANYLNLPGLRTEPIDELEFSIWARAEQFPKLQNCPHCGCSVDEDFIRNGTRPQIFRDVPHGLKSVYVEVQKQSYYCYRCQQSSTHPLPAVAPGRRMTTQMVSYIQNLSLFRPDSEVALFTGASNKTVREIAVEYRKYLDETVRFETPRVLGVDGVYARVMYPDEKKSRKKECAIVTNIEAGLVIEMWPGATIKELVECFRKLPNPERIKIVVIDMSPTLLAAVREVFPHAVIVIDLFHIQKKINEGMDNVRKRLRKGLPRKKGQQNMCRRELLRKRQDQLKPAELEERERWFEHLPQLRLAQQVVESCLRIWHSSSSKTAKRRLADWRMKFPPELREDFKELLSSFRDWEEFIINFFDHRYTNAFTESSNRLIKDIVRETRSCDFDTLRARVIFGTTVRRQMKEARREEMRRKIRKPRTQEVRRPRRRRRYAADSETGSSGALDAAALDRQLPAIQLSLF